jgi:hypothetical protein
VKAMSVSAENIFVIGATGGVGSRVVQGLIKKGVKTTAYARNEAKAKDLFKAELATGLLRIVIGDYSTLNAFETNIKGHTRLFILIVADFTKAASMRKAKKAFGKIAYQQGVRQILDLSSVEARLSGKQGILGYIHTSGEEKLWALAEKHPEERSLVVLRPAFFMTNHFMGDVHSIKHSNKLISCGSPSAKLSWIDRSGM